MFCSSCGAEVAEGAAFCGSCGAKIDNVNSAQPAAAQPTQAEPAAAQPAAAQPAAAQPAQAAPAAAQPAAAQPAQAAPAAATAQAAEPQAQPQPQPQPQPQVQPIVVPVAVTQQQAQPQASGEVLYSRENNENLLMAAFVLNVICCVALGFTIIGLAWGIPMTVRSYGIWKGKKPNTVAFGVCTLLFLSLISGILMLIADKDK